MLSQATHLVHRRGVHLRVDVTRAEEEHGLEERVVYHVQQRTTYTTHTYKGTTRCVTHCRNTETDKDDTHILDT